MNKIKKIISILATFTMVMVLVEMPAQKVSAADDHFLHDETVTINNGNTYTIHALDEGYDNNVYLSLRDMATILSGTEAAFSVEVGSDGIKILQGQNGNPERSIHGWTDEEREAYYGKSLGMNALTVDDNPRKYYTIRAAYQDGTDCFMAITSFAMLFDIEMYATGDNAITVCPGQKLTINPAELESQGFFLDVNSVLVGDATTGEVFYEYEGDKVFPIASTTKLMTCLLTEEAMANGSISADTMVTISEEASRISNSNDGTFELDAGHQAPVSELIIGALLPSSNECALALGEAIGGSEAAFVDMMNDKAAELSMDTAIFYNPNGLPSYDTSGLPSKRQNRMNAEDMFKMCSNILNNYPQIKEVTTKPVAMLPNLGRDVANTNSLLYNMPEITGLKTGTTDKAGACLVTSLTVNDGAMDHDLVVVVLGAEGSKARFTTSELMARYGKKVVLGELSADGASLMVDAAQSEDESAQKKAITAKSLVKMILREAMK